VAHLAHDGRGTGTEGDLKVLQVLGLDLQLDRSGRLTVDTQTRPSDAQVVLCQFSVLRPAAPGGVW
jgi:hypothetical protein